MYGVVAYTIHTSTVCLLLSLRVALPTLEPAEDAFYKLSVVSHGTNNKAADFFLM